MERNERFEASAGGSEVGDDFDVGAARHSFDDNAEEHAGDALSGGDHQSGGFVELQKRHQIGPKPNGGETNFWRPCAGGFADVPKKDGGARLRQSAFGNRAHLRNVIQ